MILCTPGGDIHSAYRMVRHIRRLYGEFILYCFGICKSAGTLVALGADAIRMSEFSELGPLDVQIAKPDEFFKRTSGLDMTAAVQTLGQQAYKRFEASFLDLKRNSGDIITTKTAAQIASEMAVGLFRPISEQIDPLRLGENFRQLQIALEYGRRLDVKEQILMKLIENYPSHDFVIDLDEAKTLFSHVDLLDEDDVAFEKALQEQTIEKYAEDVIHFPPQYGQPIYAHVVSSTEEETSPEALSKTNCASDNIMVNRVKIGLTTDPWHPNEEVLK
jgi:serine dehydrogenase proteinase